MTTMIRSGLDKLSAPKMKAISKKKLLRDIDEWEDIAEEEKK